MACGPRPPSHRPAWIASTADAGGNQVVIKSVNEMLDQAGETGARPTTGPIQAAPVTGSRAQAGATDGTGLIVTDFRPNGLATATWRP